MFSSIYVIFAVTCIIFSAIMVEIKQFGVALLFGLLTIFLCFCFLSSDICNKLEQQNKDKKVEEE